MEETNFFRPPLLAVEPVDLVQPNQHLASPTGQKDTESALSGTGSIEKPRMTASNVANPDEGVDRTPNTVQNLRYTFWQRMALFRKNDSARSIKISGLLLRPLALSTFPVVVYSGFMYGAVVCYFNILNAVASVILSGAPYNFRPSMVGLSYLSCLVGVLLG